MQNTKKDKNTFLFFEISARNSHEITHEIFNEATGYRVACRWMGRIKIEERTLLGGIHKHSLSWIKFMPS